jgi:transmembrane sensor
MTEHAHIHDEALDWLVRTNDPEFDRWEEFTSWLEADPGHADAYHRLAQSELEIQPFVAEPKPTPMAEPRRLGSKRLAMAASVAAVVALGSGVLMPRLTPDEHVTGPGEIATIDLGGQDRLVMNGDTRLALSGWSKRNVKLVQGQILLQLRDTAQGRVEVSSGDVQLVDVGTVFEVSRNGSQTRVIVSEGAVVADPSGARLKIDAGERLDTTDGASVLTTKPADASATGAFASGQLVYLDEPIRNVVADVQRSTGLRLSADTAIGGKPFTGTLSVAAVKREPQSLGPLLGVAIDRTPSGWALRGRGQPSEP